MSTVNPMNERIRELEDQAWSMVSDEERSKGELYEADRQRKRRTEIFVELIVRECAEIAHKQEFGEGWDGPVKDKILSRFGLKDARWYP